MFGREKTDKEIVQEQVKLLKGKLIELSYFLETMGLRQKIRERFRFKIFTDPMQEPDETCLQIFELKTWKKNREGSNYDPEYLVCPMKAEKSKGGRFPYSYMLIDVFYYCYPGSYYEPPSSEEKEFTPIDSFIACFFQIFQKEVDGYFESKAEAEAEEKLLKLEESLPEDQGFDCMFYKNPEAFNELKN